MVKSKTGDYLSSQTVEGKHFVWKIIATMITHSREVSVVLCVVSCFAIAASYPLQVAGAALGRRSSLKLTVFNPLKAQRPPATGKANTANNRKPTNSRTIRVSNIKHILIRIVPRGTAAAKSGPLLARALKIGSLTFLAYNANGTVAPLAAKNVTAASYAPDGTLPTGLVVALRLPQESVKSRDSQFTMYMRKIGQYDATVLHRKDPKVNAYMRKYMKASFLRMCVQTVIGRYKIVVKYTPKGPLPPLGAKSLRGTVLARVVNRGLFMDELYKEIVKATPPTKANMDSYHAGK